MIAQNRSEVPKYRARRSAVVGRHRSPSPPAAPRRVYTMTAPAVLPVPNSVVASAAFNTITA